MQKPRHHLKFRALALPLEHGIWGFWLEPSLLGLLLRPSLAGGFLALMGLAGLLLQQPLSLYLLDQKRSKFYPRTRWALGFATVYALLAFTLLLASLFLSHDRRYLYLLAIMLILGFFQFQARLNHNQRQLLPELLGVTALAGLVACIMLIGGNNLVTALVFWLMLILRNLGAILYVRARLRLGRVETISYWPSHLSNFSGLLSSFVFYRLGLVSLALTLIFLILFLRSLFGLSNYRFALKPKHIGMLELAFGLSLVLTAAFTSLF